MIPSGASFGVLSLCASAPGVGAPGDRLRAACSVVTDWDALLSDAEQHGLETLLLAHVRESGVELPAAVETRLKVRYLQHAHAAAVRARVLAGVLDAFEDAGIPALLLKGAALAHLVYPSPVLRPMRDVDLLVPERDADRAWRCLQDRGFERSGKDPGPGHHHLHALSLGVDGETVTVEIHRQPLDAVPFVPRLTYGELASRAQTFQIGGRLARTLGPEDMLWHIYAHGFLVCVLRPDPRLIALADLTAALAAWDGVLDRDRLRHLYPRLARALPRLREAAGTGDPASWWFDVRYGIDGSTRRLWNRVATHPATFAMAAVHAMRLKR